MTWALVTVICVRLLRSGIFVEPNGFGPLYDQARQGHLQP
jgi:hypothetical protein